MDAPYEKMRSLLSLVTQAHFSNIRLVLVSPFNGYLNHASSTDEHSQDEHTRHEALSINSDDDTDTANSSQEQSRLILCAPILRDR